MGNRAVIHIEGECTGIYMHWNGGRDSVEPLLQVARDYGIRGDDYGTARLTQIIGNTLGGKLSLGVSSLDRLDMDNGDNGTYVINDKFEIVERLYMHNVPENPPTPDAHDRILKYIHSRNDEAFEGAY